VTGRTIGPKKELFKFWVEETQMEQFRQLSERRKLSVSWLMRQAFDEYLQREDTGRTTHEASRGKKSK
jgi:hypothetical protein